jgi:hypothetical protein
VDVDLSAMRDWCSIALDFGGVTHKGSDGEPKGSASSGINKKRNCVEDGLVGVAHGVSNDETIDDTNVGEKR